MQAHGLTPDQITLATNSGTLPAGGLGSGYDLILSVAHSAAPGHHGVQLLGALAAALRPGGELFVKHEAGLPVRTVRRHACGARVGWVQLGLAVGLQLVLD